MRQKTGWIEEENGRKEKDGLRGRMINYTSKRKMRREVEWAGSDVRRAVLWGQKPNISLSLSRRLWLGLGVHKPSLVFSSPYIVICTDSHLYKYVPLHTVVVLLTILLITVILGQCVWCLLYFLALARLCFYEPVTLKKSLL